MQVLLRQRHEQAMLDQALHDHFWRQASAGRERIGASSTAGQTSRAFAADRMTLVVGLLAGCAGDCVADPFGQAQPRPEALPEEPEEPE